VVEEKSIERKGYLVVFGKTIHSLKPHESEKPQIDSLKMGISGGGKVGKEGRLLRRGSSHCCQNLSLSQELAAVSAVKEE